MKASLLEEDQFGNLSYMDDKLIVVRSRDEIPQHVSAIENINAEFGLKINARKTHMMVIDAESDGDQVITILLARRLVMLTD